MEYVLEANPGIFEGIITDSRSQMQGFGGGATPSHLRHFIFQSIQSNKIELFKPNARWS